MNSLNIIQTHECPTFLDPKRLILHFYVPQTSWILWGSGMRPSTHKIHSMRALVVEEAVRLKAGGHLRKISENSLLGAHKVKQSREARTRALIPLSKLQIQLKRPRELRLDHRFASKFAPLPYVPGCGQPSTAWCNKVVLHFGWSWSCEIGWWADIQIHLVLCQDAHFIWDLYENECFWVNIYFKKNIFIWKAKRASDFLSLVHLPKGSSSWARPAKNQEPRTPSGSPTCKWQWPNGHRLPVSKVLRSGVSSSLDWFPRALSCLPMMWPHSLGWAWGWLYLLSFVVSPCPSSVKGTLGNLCRAQSGSMWGSSHAGFAVLEVLHPGWWSVGVPAFMEIMLLFLMWATWTHLPPFSPFRNS